LPTVREQFGEATAQLDFMHRRRLSFHSNSIVGERWALLPSAAGFVDPLLSTGFPLTLLGVARLAEAIEHDWGTPHFANRLKQYAAKTSDELSATERLIAALYANMNDFPLFTSLSMLYFAAASFTETARRLDRPEFAGGFLMHDHPIFGPRSRDCLERAVQRLTLEQREDLMEQIQRVIEPFNVAGLSDNKRRNWYPVKAEDLFDAAHKLGASRAEIEKLLSRSGFF
jgi:FADH2 O2-dependent halogenase